MGSGQLSMHCIVLYCIALKSRRKGFELEPWFLPRFPAHFFPTGVFSGRFFLASVQIAFALLAVAQLSYFFVL